jgi:hypothetical protein
LKYTKDFRGSVDRYKNLQGLKQIQIMKDLKPNIVAIAKTLRKGDRIMIWHDGYQVFIKEMGASNFNITNDLEKKDKKGLTSQKK